MTKNYYKLSAILASYLCILLFAILPACKKDEATQTLPPGVEPYNDGYIINGAVTWPDVKSGDEPDYVFDKNLTIEGQLTIEPGVIIQFKRSAAVNPATSIIVNGVVIANGNALNPIKFEGDGDLQGYQGLNLNSKTTNENQFTYCIFDQKLTTPSGAPYIMGALNGEPSRPNIVNVRVENCTFKNNTYGARILAGVNLTSFQNNMFTNNLSTNYNCIFHISVLDKVNNTNTFTDNAVQRIGIDNSNDGLGHTGTMDIDATIHNVGCDYVVGNGLGGSNEGKINFREGALTIEPGITFYMSEYSFIYTQYKYIRAIGTPSQHIVFKALNNTNNTWNGVYVDCYDDFKNPEQCRFEYCDFYHGGANSTGWGNFGLGFKSQFYYLYPQFTTANPAFFVQNCTFNQCNLLLYAPNDANYINQDYTTTNTFN